MRDQVPLREIARRLCIVRDTVRRNLRSETRERACAERRANRDIDKDALRVVGTAQACGGAITQAAAHAEVDSWALGGTGV